MSATFELHPKLRADCHALGKLGTTHVLLHRNGSVPWFILVPAVAVTEVYEMPPGARATVQTQMDTLARFVKRHFNSDKINVASLGNIVPQLHVHVIGRRRDDACWPQPIWGLLPARDYAEAEIVDITRALRADPALAAAGFQ